MSSTPEPNFRLVDRDGAPLDLVLFKFDACPFCRRVQQRIAQLNLPVRFRDTLREPGAREELIRIGGRPTVPCLIINGKPLYESVDIVRYLESEVRLIEASSGS